MGVTHPTQPNCNGYSKLNLQNSDGKRFTLWLHKKPLVAAHLQRVVPVGCDKEAALKTPVIFSQHSTTPSDRHPQPGTQNTLEKNEIRNRAHPHKTSRTPAFFTIAGGRCDWQLQSSHIGWWQLAFVSWQLAFVHKLAQWCFRFFIISLIF